MNKWHIHIRSHRALETDEVEKSIRYDIHFLPDIELYYDSTKNCEKCKESPMLTIQWLIWGVNIWFHYHAGECKPARKHKSKNSRK